MKKMNTLDPMLLLLLGACPAMAASVSVLSALAMGVAVIVTLVLTSALVSALKGFVAPGGQLTVYVLVSAGIVSVLQLLMNALLPSVYQMLGVYLAVVAVNLLVLESAEGAFTGKEKNCMNSLMTGLRFLAVVVVTALIREVFGSASIAGIALPFLSDYRIATLTQASGGFFVYALVAACVKATWKGTDMDISQLAAKAAGLTDAQKEGE